MTVPPITRAPIRVLPERAAERIAAGEVIERPSSVVKELVENALDAGARSVRVEVRGGGLRSIRVVDDGCGIPADEIALAFQRHATSKIRGVDDLERLTTLGFRGEALPSIAAVAEVTVHTATADSSLGNEALVRHGAVIAVTPRPRAPGATIAVRYLFQTVPARLKFVANARHEVVAIGALVRRYALAYPTVRFTLLVEGRPALQTTGDGLADALAAVYGASVAAALRPLPAFEVAGARLCGYLSDRHVTRPHRGGLTLIVNGRWVEARALLTALEAAYRPLLPRGRHPIALLHCALAPDALDVNVHPAKTEVKFLRGAELADGLAAWVREALARTPAQLPADADLGWSLAVLAPPEPPPAPDAGADPSDPPDRSDPTAPGPVARDAADPLTAWPAASALAAAPPPGRYVAESRAPEWLPLPPGSLPPLHLIEQVQDALLLCEGPAGLYLIDQHRAHERILYERLRARHGSAPLAAVEPLVLELKPAQAARLAARLADLAALGFACEWFGGRSFLVRATPELPGGAEALAPALDALLAEAAREEDDWQDRLLVSVACRGALRRGLPLARDTQRALLAELNQASAPAVCPHGSPLILHLSAPFLARQFRWR